VAMTRTELIIQLFKVIIGLAFGAYFDFAARLRAFETDFCMGIREQYQ
jgi:hypothetical protein